MDPRRGDWSSTQSPPKPALPAKAAWPQPGGQSPPVPLPPARHPPPGCALPGCCCLHPSCPAPARPWRPIPEAELWAARGAPVPDLPRCCRLRFAGSEPAGRGANLGLRHLHCRGPGCGWPWAAAPRDPPAGNGVSLPLMAAGVSLPVGGSRGRGCASVLRPRPGRAGAACSPSPSSRCEGCCSAGESWELGGTGQGSMPKHI